ncbi:hypothetical protein BPAE_0138g00060 [Botrytis paeoniae]|uniref:Uncharacterized protein n=1 Tax=Botrytis paeoniae TaxID=278948 RepID=A0A4Z1FKS7_9HELO|nr:hypothetical protein BPAE_0138g00060 [Botrytis paeoniae]
MEDEFCQKVDLNLDISIDLPANAPQGHPHLLNVKRPRNKPHPPKYKKRKSNQIEFPEDLSLVDVLATILFDWKPAALHHLLNVENEQFYCAADGDQGSVECYEWDRFILWKLAQMQRYLIVFAMIKKWEIISAQNYGTEKTSMHWVPSDPKRRFACEKIEKRMAQLISPQYLVDVVLQDMIFPVLIYEPEAKCTKGQKSKATITNELNDVGRESNTGSSSDSLMKGNKDLRVAELEAQVSVLQKSIEELTDPANKRRRGQGFKAGIVEWKQVCDRGIMTEIKELQDRTDQPENVIKSLKLWSKTSQAVETFQQR